MISIMNPDQIKLKACGSNIQGFFLESTHIHCITMEKHLGNFIGPE